MKPLHRAALLLALAASAMPAFAFYQVVEETARLEIAPGNIRSEHVDHGPPSPDAFRDYHHHSFDQDLNTATSQQFVSASLERYVPGRRGEEYNLNLNVFASASGVALTNITQKVEYEVVFDIFKTSTLLVDNPRALTFEKIAADNSRQVIEFPTNYLEDAYLYSQQIPAITPGRYAITLNLVFSPFDGSLAAGQLAYKQATFRLFQSPVPEPASWALAGFGLLGVVAMRRLRRQQKT